MNFSSIPLLPSVEMSNQGLASVASQLQCLEEWRWQWWRWWWGWWWWWWRLWWWWRWWWWKKAARPGGSRDQATAPSSPPPGFQIKKMKLLKKILPPPTRGCSSSVSQSRFSSRARSGRRQSWLGLDRGRKMSWCWRWTLCLCGRFGMAKDSGGVSCRHCISCDMSHMILK